MCLPYVSLYLFFNFREMRAMYLNFERQLASQHEKIEQVQKSMQEYRLLASRIKELVQMNIGKLNITNLGKVVFHHSIIFILHI